MYTYRNALSSPLIDKLNDITYKFFYGIDHKENSKNFINMYTNMVWDKDFRGDSGLVLFIALNQELVEEVQKELTELKIFDESKYKSLVDYGQVMMQIWSKGSYAKEHIDQTYGAAATVYLNNWTYEDGGRLEFLNDNTKEWEYIVPEYNLLAFNDKKIPHRVSVINNNNELRNTLQVFMYNKEE
jgi:hypothetical protein